VRPSEIRAISIPSPMQLGTNDATAIALAYQQSKCVLLREICAQLAEQSEALRQLVAKDWPDAANTKPGGYWRTVQCSFVGCKEPADLIINREAYCRIHDPRIIK